MSRLTRREFVRMSAITAGVSMLPRQAFTSGQHTLGRTLGAVQVFQRPDAQSAVLSQLWPDTVVQITRRQPGWLWTPAGCIQAEEVQEMVRFGEAPVIHPDAMPYWAEVRSAAENIYAWCAVDSPVLTRIGHNGIMQVTDRLVVDGSLWLALADSTDRLLGWTPATSWRPVESSPAALASVQVMLDARENVLYAYREKSLIQYAPVSHGLPDTAMQVPLAQGTPGLPYLADVERYGIPYPLLAGEFIIAGAYWHNRFGHGMPGRLIQLPPEAARTLYLNAGPGSTLTIIANQRTNDTSEIAELYVK